MPRGKLDSARGPVEPSLGVWSGNRKLLDEGFISQAREERLQELWVQKLKRELKDIDAPVLGKPGPRRGS